MDKKKKVLEQIVGQNRLKLDEPMSLHTTIKIGGPALFYVDTEKIDELISLVQAAYEQDIDVLVVGGGSNMIVSDKGFDGLVIKNNCRKFDVMSMTGKMKNREEGWKMDVDSAYVFAEGGTIMNQLVRFTIEQGLAGLEYQLGLPGTVGGGIHMNSNWAKASSFVGDHVYRVRLLTFEGEVKEVDASYFEFGYDHSILQKKPEIVLSVIFKLLPSDKKVLWERATKALEDRSASQPKNIVSGCTFRNTSIAESTQVPVSDKVIAAGYLIEKAGMKDKKIDNAMISGLHANFLVNTGGATSSEIVTLVNTAKEEVLQRCGVHLNLELYGVGM